MTFRQYLKSGVIIAVLNALALAVLLGLAMLLIGDTSADVNANIGFEQYDGLWLFLLLPALFVLILVVVSPLAYLIYRLSLRLPFFRGR